MGVRLEAARCVRAVSAATAALCLLAALPGQGWASARPDPYAFAEDAPTVRAAGEASGARQLKAGGRYRSALGPGAKGYYRISLDSAASAYVSATALPPPGVDGAYGDGVKVSILTAEGFTCSYDAASFGSLVSPRPLVATAARLIGPGEGTCQEAGTYYVLVERKGSHPENWDLELQFATEPALRGKAPSAPPTDAAPSASAEPPAGPARPREGGTSFNDAPALEDGAWRDRITSGTTLFYRVPVDWGQRLRIGAGIAPGSGGEGSEPGEDSSSEGSGSGSPTGQDSGGAGLGEGPGTGSSDGPGDGSDTGTDPAAGTDRAGGDYVSSALELALYNPVRATVARTDTSYDGQPKKTTLRPMAPVAYGNRFAAAREEMTSARFAGWYYLAVHLNDKVAGTFGDRPLALTLNIAVEGEAQDGPGYAGSPQPSGLFGAEDGPGTGGGPADPAEDTDDDPLLGPTAARAVAAGGFGTGTLLLAVLGLWTLLARRGAARAERRQRDRSARSGQATPEPPSYPGR